MCDPIEPAPAHPTSEQPPKPITGGPLSPEHLRALAEARVRSKRVRRASAVAALSGWTMVFFAMLTMLGAVFGDWIGAAFGVALLEVACNELRGGGMLKRFDPRGARVLGYNQFLLVALIVGYAAWSMNSALRDPVLKSMGGTTGDPQMDAVVRQASTMVAYGLYGGIALVGVVAPALTAWYYFSRERHARALLAETPAWIIETLRAAG